SACDPPRLKMPVLAGILQSLQRLGRENAGVRSCENADLHARRCGYSTNGLADYPETELQCRADAALAGFLLGDFAATERPSAAARPAARISSENSPLPAIRDSTSAPIMVASVAEACLRAALRGRSGIWSAIISIIRSSLAAKARRALGPSRAISAPSVGTAQPWPGSSRCSVER